MADLPPRDGLLPGIATPLMLAVSKTEGRLDDIDEREVRRVRSIDEAEGAYLTHLAAENSVDVWDEDWPIEVRREVVRIAPLIHAIKGTPVSTERALAALRVDAVLTEWWEETPRGTPYTFRVFALVRARLYDGPPLDARTIRAVFAQVKATKPRTRFFDLFIGVGMESGLGLAPVAVARPRVETVAAAVLPVPPAQVGLGLAPVAVARPRVETVATAVLPVPTSQSGLGLAPVAAVRVLIALTAVPG